MKGTFLRNIVSALLILLTLGVHSRDIQLSGLQFRQLSTLHGLPTNEVRRLYQDREGYIWIATTSGLCLYDGYQLKTYKSNLYTPGLLSNNNIRCLSEDLRHQLWIGTNNGINILDRVTGEFRRLTDPRFHNNVINTIHTSSRGITYIGSDNGLFRYDTETDSCYLYNSANTGIEFGPYSVQHLYEDNKKQLWISTSQGLFRYDPHSDSFFSYARVNPYHSSHFIFQDSQNRTWMGTFGGGLYYIENPYEIAESIWHPFRHEEKNENSLIDDIVYVMEEDLHTQTLWIGTRSGLSILDMASGEPHFTNYTPNKMTQDIPFNEVNSMIRDNQGTIWLGMLGGGVNFINTRKPTFTHHPLEEVKSELTSAAVRSMLIDRQERIWLGIGSYGFIIREPDTGEISYYKDTPDFRAVRELPTINSIYQSPTDGKIWLSTFNMGILVYNEQLPQGKRLELLNAENHPWLPSNCIYEVLEDRNRNYWIATKNGVAVLTPEGTGYNLTENSYPGYFYALAEDNKGNIWAGSGSYGLLRFTPSPTHPDKPCIKNYPLTQGSLSNTTIQVIFTDSKNRLWIGTDGNGLYLYNPAADNFISLSPLLNLPGDGVFSIEEDKQGNLWLGTNMGLIRLTAGENPERSVFRVYTVRHGLQDNRFLKGVSAWSDTYGMFFGGHNGYNTFFPEDIEEYDTENRIVLTDIKIYNQSWYDQPEKIRHRIAAVTPWMAEKIVLNHRQNNFTIEFSGLNYTEPSQTHYFYQLRGFDRKWQPTDASRRFAHYNNLSPGNYTFEVYSSNGEILPEHPLRRLEVTILPPLWKSWWAWLLYTLALCGIVYITLNTLRNRMKLREALRIKEVEKTKADELNHAKLQFFTNITHELLTPLTIISATVDELKIKAPGNQELYQTMTRNINRLIRLLQQILEFRKAETGNLQLKVSRGDLTAFIQNSVDSFRPLIKKKQLHFSLTASPEVLPAYFDFDKMDKILYNLLSNAAKYNREGGTVRIELTLEEKEQTALLTVRDNGEGMDSETLRTLFTRFYEGNHRRFKTMGTGIGLSLTKDLVELHNGTLTVESKPGEGTTFQVKIPITRQAYREEQIDDRLLSGNSPIEAETPVEPEEIENRSGYSLLILEDNEELLQVMVKLLGREYRIYTAGNGKEGMEVIFQEEIDLVISDVMMPVMDGTGFVKALKANFETSHIPVILLTARNREEDRIEAYESGADGYITKPFSLSVLHAKIRNLLKAKERTAHDFRNQLVFEAQELQYTTIDEEFLERAVACVHRHLDNPDFDQQQFISEMGSSKSTLYKKLKSLTGFNTSAFIRNIRLKAACRIAEEKKNIRISELAYAVGFNDPKYFSSCFKKEFGILPKEYIEKFTTGPDKKKKTEV